MGQFLMPSLGADMEAGTLIEWLKSPGDAVSNGDLIAVVETQKGAIEIEAFEDGILEEYLVGIGKKVPVGTPLAIIRTKGEAPVERAVQEKAPKPEPPVPVPAATSPTPEPAPTPAIPLQTDRVRITPAALRLAQSKGIDPRTLGDIGTGPGGALTLADIERANPPSPVNPMDGMRAAIAAAMTRSKAEIPHYYLAHTVDLTAAQTFVDQTNADRPPEARLLLGALYLKAVAKALRKYTEFNGYLTDGQFHPASAINTGMAITIRGGGLVAPAILDAANLNLDDLMTSMRDLAARVRTGRFRATELTDATITVTSLGERGVDQLFGVIYPPQVAIVGIGTPREHPFAVGGAVEERLTTTITLSADHRVSDGHRGALFLRAIDKHLQKPEKL
ncbi:dihydrolipoamide acetyltransferase family protein [Profundibacter amoris]|uniref:Dihydrolipoamide acetyltransferase component of pyruvate dehydrogenase complex n=1 Tax=Profundibacter amoris TaxID=2171755 RepID=A0A347UEI1_9RHOB|nr:dihydrolipoamide acetyltransferase family protein [Profundibacter amoris]AXX97259.1 2-oxo acid dehydrogenase subunit E2 [Profundibacter amoris]